jgi:hypothetical protein
MVHYVEGIRDRVTPQREAPAGPPPTNIQDYMKWRAVERQRPMPISVA